MDNLLFQWGQGFVEGMLEPYAKDEAGASQDQVGLLFLALGLVYMVAAPVQGQIIDRIQGVDATVYSLVANVIGFVAFLLLGPAIFLDGWRKKSRKFAGAIRNLCIGLQVWNLPWASFTQQWRCWGWGAP